MHTVPIERAQADLSALIAELKPGDEIVITRSNTPVARLRAEPEPTPVRRSPGSAIGEIEILCEDDEHLKDFGEYMP